MSLTKTRKKENHFKSSNRNNVITNNVIAFANMQVYMCYLLAGHSLINNLIAIKSSEIHRHCTISAFGIYI